MIFGLGKKRTKATFKQRVTEFWEWYPQVADRLWEYIESGKSDELTSLVSQYMEKSFPELAWVFGPGESGGHSFTLSGEGVLAKQLLTAYWLSRAPEIPRWTFYASRQPSSPESLKGIAISLREGVSIDADKICIDTHVDAERELIDIVAWHAEFSKLPESDQFQILFLMLDEALGEFGTETWLGEVKIAPVARSNNTVSIVTLPEKIRQVNEYYHWEKHSPLETYACYETREQSKAPRGDTLFGSSCIPDIIFDFIGNNGKLTDSPLKGTGADFAYLSLDGALFPAGQEVAVRSNIEEAVGEALEEADSGRTLGGAFGQRRSYIDLLLFDGAESQDIIRKVLSNLQLSDRAELKLIA